MEEAKKYERIERYLAGELPAAERQAFEAEMAADPEFRAEVALHRELAGAANENDVANFEASLGEAMRDGRKPSGRRRWIAVLLAAAAVLLLLWLGRRWLQHRKSTPPPERIYAGYVDLPEELPGTIRIRSAEGGDPESSSSQEAQLRQNWTALNEAYQRGHYQEALAILENFQSIDPAFAEENPGVYHYHRGLLQLQLDRPAAAASSFAQVDRGNYAEDAAWKRAMALLLVEDRREEAIELLQRISNAAHPRREEAREVLKQLDD